MIILSFRFALAAADRLGLVDLEGSNKMDRISFGDMSGVSILSMNSMSWNLDSPWQFHLDLISSMHADATVNK
jgi:hypothetical protein